MEKGQNTRWSKAEMEVIKSNFTGEQGEEMLYKIRDSFFQTGKAPTLSREVKELLRKMLIPTTDPNLPFGEQTGLQANVRNNLKRIEDYSIEGAIPHIKANDLLIQYIENQLQVLEGKQEAETINLEDLSKPLDKNSEQRYIDMLAYMFIPTYIDAGMRAFRELANHKEMTEEEKKKQAEMNSSR